MICPVCGTHVPDDATVCPACHAKLHENQAPATQGGGVFCKKCGALVPAGRVTCPVCGFPLDDELVETVIEHEAGLGEQEAQPTHAVAEQVESVIPPKPVDGYQTSSPKEHMPHFRVVLVTALCALLAVGGTALAITRPWDPNSNIRHALTDADTSWAGYPGELSHLSGQDKTATKQEEDGFDDSSSDPLFDKLTSFYSTLGDISSKADSNEETLRSVVAGNGGDASQGADDAKQLSLDLSNAISDFQDQDMGSSPYEDQAQSLTTLASYLRNRLDAMTQAWSAVTLAPEPTDAASKVSALLDGGSSGGADAWKSMFESNYDAAQPQQQSSSEG